MRIRVKASSPNVAAAGVVADGAGIWLPRKTSLWPQPRLSPLLFHSLSCVPWSAFPMNARWPPFWCQARRRRPEAGHPGREDLERGLAILSPASAARHLLGAAGPHPSTRAARALAAVGPGRGSTACAAVSSSRGFSQGEGLSHPLRCHPQSHQPILPLLAARWRSKMNTPRNLGCCVTSGEGEQGEPDGALGGRAQ